MNAEFESLQPWYCTVNYEGRQYGGAFDPFKDYRLITCMNRHPEAKRILELSSFEGLSGAYIATRPNVQEVIGIDGRDILIRRANFIKKLFNLKNIEFVHANLETFDLAQLGHFDLVTCIGILYHLPEPHKLLHQIRRVTDCTYIWTHCATFPGTTLDNYEGLWYGEHGVQDILSGLSAQSFWPTNSALMRMIRDAGFPRITVLPTQPNPNGAVSMFDAHA